MLRFPKAWAGPGLAYVCFLLLQATSGRCMFIDILHSAGRGLLGVSPFVSVAAWQCALSGSLAEGTLGTSLYQVCVQVCHYAISRATIRYA